MVNHSANDAASKKIVAQIKSYLKEAQEAFPGESAQDYKDIVQTILENHPQSNVRAAAITEAIQEGLGLPQKTTKSTTYTEDTITQLYANRYGDLHDTLYGQNEDVIKGVLSLKDKNGKSVAKNIDPSSLKNILASKSTELIIDVLSIKTGKNSSLADKADRAMLITILKDKSASEIKDILNINPSFPNKVDGATLSAILKDMSISDIKEILNVKINDTSLLSDRLTDKMNDLLSLLQTRDVSDIRDILSIKTSDQFSLARKFCFHEEALKTLLKGRSNDEKDTLLKIDTGARKMLKGSTRANPSIKITLGDVLTGRY